MLKYYTFKNIALLIMLYAIARNLAKYSMDRISIVIIFCHRIVLRDDKH